MTNINFVDFAETHFLLNRSAVLTHIGCLRDEMYYVSPVHRHLYEIEIVYVLSGVGKVIVAGEEYPIGPNDVAIYQNGVLHQEDLGECDTVIKFYHCKLKELKLYDYPDMQLLPEGARPVFSAGEAGALIRTCFERMYDECERRAIGFGRISQHLLETVILLIMRKLREKYDVVRGTGGKPVSVCLKEYIDHNYMTRVVFKEVADHLYVNYFYLSHAFKSKMGLSPQEYLIQKRISEAQRLLEDTANPVRDIAAQVGYNTPSHFTAQFKRVMGMSPSDFRQRKDEYGGDYKRGEESDHK